MLDKRNFYINGKWVSPSEPNDLEVINPSNEDPCAVISQGNISDTNKAVKAAKNAFPKWSRTSKEERISLLKKLYEFRMKDDAYIVVKGEAINEKLDMHPMYKAEDTTVVFKNRYGKLYKVDVPRLIRVFNNNIWQHKRSVK